MTNTLDGPRLIAVAGLLLAGTVLFADGTTFSDFTPLASSAGPTADESAPIVFGNPDFRQRSITDRQSQLAALEPNSGSWDMNTLNQTGRRNGRYLFTVFETGHSGVQRHDLRTGETDTIWQSVVPGTHVSFDASFWTPWGTLITAEEAWSSAGDPAHPLPYGRLFELKNPTRAPAIFDPVTAVSNDGADFVHQNVIPRTSHEGIQLDGAGNLYFVDELNGGNLYRYTPAADFKKVVAGRADYFAAGQTFVLRVGDGNTPNATGAFTWVPFTDKRGKALPGALTVTDANGVTSVDARNTTNLPQFKGTDYQRPEDMQIQTVRGADYLYVTTTTTHETYRLDLNRRMISVFADRNTIDLATGTAVGSALANPDNLAVDHDGNIYIVEDRSGGVDDDIWFANDRNKDGDLKDPGEGLARWASNGTVGSEFTGLYFDPFNRDRAWVNIQHPASGNDRTIEITIPGDHHHRDDDDDDEDDHDDSDDRHD
jgi:secreted PhoX family phosphatase